MSQQPNRPSQGPPLGGFPPQGGPPSGPPGPPRGPTDSNPGGAAGPGQGRPLQPGPGAGWPVLAPPQGQGPPGAGPGGRPWPSAAGVAAAGGRPMGGGVAAAGGRPMGGAPSPGPAQGPPSNTGQVPAGTASSPFGMGPPRPQWLAPAAVAAAGPPQSPAQALPPPAPGPAPPAAPSPPAEAAAAKPPTPAPAVEDPPRPDDLSESITGLNWRLQATIKAIGESVVLVSNILRDPAAAQGQDKGGGGQGGPGSQNVFGDVQLAEDLATDRAIFLALRHCGAVAAASSEETPEVVPLGPEEGLFVAFDPLDGSSVIGANFAVGSIFAVFPFKSPIGRRGEEMEAAAYAVYGPRTLLVLAHRDTEPGAAPGGRVAREFVWSPSQKAWRLLRDRITLSDKKIFAPANLRAAAENRRYRAVVEGWIDAMYTLRYTGGMVPDVHHILSKGGGVFCSPTSGSAPAKLRLLYEVAPLAYITEAAGGRASTGTRRVLEVVIESTNARSQVVMGSQGEVTRALVSLTPTAADAAVTN